jgi:hypothetical protein
VQAHKPIDARELLKGHRAAFHNYFPHGRDHWSEGLKYPCFAARRM